MSALMPEKAGSRASHDCLCLRHRAPPSGAWGGRAGRGQRWTPVSPAVAGTSASRYSLQQTGPDAAGRRRSCTASGSGDWRVGRGLSAASVPDGVARGLCVVVGRLRPVLSAATMGIQKQNSLSSFIRKPFKKKKKSKSKQSAGGDGVEPVTANGACSSPPACERCAPLESRVSQLSAELRELRAELTALKGSVAALQGQPAQRTARHRRDSFESCWDASSLRFYSALEVLSHGNTPPRPAPARCSGGAQCTSPRSRASAVRPTRAPVLPGLTARGHAAHM